MKNVNGIQTLFEDAICPTPSGKGDMASSDPGVPVRDAPSATSSVVGPMTQTVQVKGENNPSTIKGS
jgi:hypothetical protein